jgi:hypothetical protein
MSVDATAEVIAEMLESDDFIERIQSDPDTALSAYELTAEERDMVVNAAAEGIQNIVDTRQGKTELSEEELENVAGGRKHFSISSLSGYMNSHAGRISSLSQTMLRQSINRRFGGDFSASPISTIVL